MDQPGASRLLPEPAKQLPLLKRATGLAIGCDRSRARLIRCSPGEGTCIALKPDPSQSAFQPRLRIFTSAKHCNGEVNETSAFEWRYSWKLSKPKKT